MMTLVFYRTGDKVIHCAGPVPYVEVAGGSLRVGPDGRQLAEYHDGVWRVEGHDAPKYVVSGSGPLRLEGERPGEPIVLGEFAQLEIVDGAIYTWPGCALLARFDESSATWYICRDKSSCATLIVEENHSAGRPSQPPSAPMSIPRDATDVSTV
jgi:hypothetical protein